MKKVCPGCEKEFNARRNSVKFCSFECSVVKQCTPRNKCKNCDNLVKENKNPYCSRKCASENRSPMKEETKLKIGRKLKGIPTGRSGERLVKYVDFTCPYCKETSERPPSNTHKSCGKPECIKQHQSKSTGGYREGSGRSKSGYYNGIYCGSTYELVWMMYNDAHLISYKRFEGSIGYGDGKRYFPDFIQGNKVIEIKGFHTETVDIKKAATEAAGYEIEVLYKEDLKPMFDWFKVNYKGKQLVEMYDGHKPKFEYECSCCNKTFGAEKQKKTELKYCSRVCAGRHRNYLKYND